MASTPEELALIERQRAYFASDEHIRRRAEPFCDISPEEGLRDAIEMCEQAAYFLSLKSEAELDRVLDPEPIPPDTLILLEAIQRACR